MYEGPDPGRTHLPNDTRSVSVRRGDLPVHCPLPDMSLWNSHPQVYIPLNEVGDEAMCPYCGTHFRLAEDGDGARAA